MPSSTISNEWQFDGLVGPTHNYAGLAHGNVASASNAGAVSNPRAAALQGLRKMRFVRDLGVPQAFLPPHPRPLIPLLQALGFGGGHSRAAIAHTLESAYANAPELLASVYSSSFMWAANAATVSPSADTADGKLHLTPANLVSHFHRAIEAPFTTRLLRRIFANPQHFTVHDPLPSSLSFSDEGAANHMRVQSSPSAAGIHCFVVGTNTGSGRYQARQRRAASEAIARQHGLRAESVQFIPQNPQAIDAGVFHNDVIAMNTDGLMIAHELAFADAPSVMQALTAQGGQGFRFVEISDAELPIADAVRSYLFNSQLLLVRGHYVLVAPRECEENQAANSVVQKLVADGILSAAHFLDVRESMRNGGGPACLRLRVRMNAAEAAAVHPGMIADDARLAALERWVGAHYREALSLNDLRDPSLIDELRTACEALEKIIALPGLYGDVD